MSIVSSDGKQFLVLSDFICDSERVFFPAAGGCGGKGLLPRASAILPLSSLNWNVVVGFTFLTIDITFKYAHKPCKLFMYCSLAGGYVARIPPPMAETGIMTPVGPWLVI